MGSKVTVVVLLGVLTMLFACSEEKPKPIDKPAIKPVVEVAPVVAPFFNRDSAYQYIQKQVDFGPRTPNSKAHNACGDYLVNELKKQGATVIEQTGVVTAFNNAKLNIRNIIAQFQPEKQTRVMLFAHWDTRPFADRDTKDKAKPIDGANDGASGVGVLLEVARLLKEQPTNVGVDIIFFDAEDYGAVQGSIQNNQMSDDWCLGTQYWANNPPIPNYKPRYGILLDMVGAENAVFPREYLSEYFAPNVVNTVWAKAKQLGYGNYFVDAKVPAPGITDDHRYVNILAKIPSIDIIHYDVNEMDFGSFHHTHNDNMDVINKNTLKAVGQTITEVIYNEK